MEKIKVLYGLGYYWPGHERYAATGPVQSFEALVPALKDKMDFMVIALDRKPGSDEYMLSPEEEGRWVQKTDKQVRYIKGGFANIGELAELINHTPHELIVLNSFFDYRITLPLLALRYFEKIPKTPVILSPRGEFSPGALELKSLKKRCYLLFNRIFGLTRDVTLHATNQIEADLFRANKLPCKRVEIAHVISRYFDRPVPVKQQDSQSLQLAFVGRIAPMKNLGAALEILRLVKSNVQFDIYGPLVDEAFWTRCEDIIKQLPHNISVSYKGPIANQDVPQTLSAYDLFFMPTLGENFGHVIHEALMSGVPCLISDQTPWRGLEEKKAGWDLPLDAPESFASKIDMLAAMPSEQRAQLKDDAREYGEKRWSEQKAIEETLHMYQNSLKNA